ncbi:sodium/hydrogen exchanger 2-like [Solea solea]|uniref:sodium/hydrogen exchanger 2-like n=1 Tax=Solea solea TaxID=90069 RepID=UPI00272A3AB2|nr:sodium/hydrogen exchanger 2-like [Solea solea]
MVSSVWICPLWVFSLDYHHVQAPFEIGLRIMLASLAKLGFHWPGCVPAVVPESCHHLGWPPGGRCDRCCPSPLVWLSFFLSLLPPVILEAGYFLPERLFFENLRMSFTKYAVLRTLWNVLGIGLSLYSVCVCVCVCALAQNSLGDIPLLYCLFFGSMIAAVHPVRCLLNGSWWSSPHSRADIIALLFVFLYSYLSYLTSEMLHHSLPLLLTAVVNKLQKNSVT